MHHCFMQDHAINGSDILMRNDYYKWVVPNYNNTSIKSSPLRLEIASKEAQKEPVELKEIIKIVNEFLLSMDMEAIPKPKMELNAGQSYRKQLKEKGVFINLDSEEDIVWMKFTVDGYLGVVGSGIDINFSYDNTSGEILNFLKKQWDERFILAFPLIKSPQSLNKFDKHLMESGIGNYLTSHHIPILDFYSHNI